MHGERNASESLILAYFHINCSTSMGLCMGADYSEAPADTPLCSSQPLDRVVLLQRKGSFPSLLSGMPGCDIRAEETS